MLDGQPWRVEKIAYPLVVVFAAHQPHLLEMRLEPGIVIHGITMGDADAFHPVLTQGAVDDVLRVKGKFDPGELPAVPRPEAEARPGTRLAGDVQHRNGAHMLNRLVRVDFLAVFV